MLRNIILPHIPALDGWMSLLVFTSNVTIVFYGKIFFCCILCTLDNCRLKVCPVTLLPRRTFVVKNFCCSQDQFQDLTFILPFCQFVFYYDDRGSLFTYFFSRHVVQPKRCRIS